MADNNTTKSSRVKNIVATVIIVVISILLIPILVVNLTLIIKGNVRKDVPPDIFGIAPLAVTSGSMSGDKEDSFDQGALIYVKVLDENGKQALKKDDVICFKLENGAFVTHRIVTIMKDSGGNITSITTKGDANGEDVDPAIELDDVFGICIGSSAGLGGFALFLQTPWGIVVFLGIPAIAFIIYDVVRITLYNKRLKAENAASGAEEALNEKDEEIMRLRAIIEEQQNAKFAPQESADGEAPCAETAETSAEETSTETAEASSEEPDSKED